MTPAPNDHELDRIRDQTAANSASIAQLTVTVGQLASTVEKHERMMVAGFDKMENALSSGLGAVNDKLTSHVTNLRPPWWQLVSVAGVFFTILTGFLVFINAPQDDKISNNKARLDKYRDEQVQTMVDVAKLQENQRVREIITPANRD